MTPLPLTEKFVQAGAHDTLNTTSGSLPPSGSPLTLTLTFAMKSGKPHFIEILAKSAAAIAAAYSFSGNVKFYNAADVVIQENVLAAHPTLISAVLSHQKLIPIPATDCVKAVYVATYVSGTDPAGVDVSMAFVQA